MCHISPVIIKDESLMEELFHKLSVSPSSLREENRVIPESEEPDAVLRKYLNFFFLLKYRKHQIVALNQHTEADVAYSMYYWYTKYLTRYELLYGTDVGMEQMQYKIMEEIDQTVDEQIDCQLLEELENEIAKNASV